MAPRFAFSCGLQAKHPVLPSSAIKHVKSVICLESFPGSLTRKECFALESRKSCAFGNALSTVGLGCEAFSSDLLSVHQFVGQKVRRTRPPSHLLAPCIDPWQDLVDICGPSVCVWSSFCQNEGRQFSSRFTKHKCSIRSIEGF